MAWVDVNTVQFMTTNHSIDKMKEVVYKSAKRQHGVPSSAIHIAEDEANSKLPFPAPVVEYNTHMGGSDGNAQQRSYYSPHRPNRRYWWPLMIFLLNAAVLNAFKLWCLLNPTTKMTHREFQLAIIEELIIAGSRRKLPPVITVQSPIISEKACQWEHTDKRAYCGPCKEEDKQLKKRRALDEISPNAIRKKRTAQTRWQCISCGPCCRKDDCWKKLHST